MADTASLMTQLAQALGLPADASSQAVVDAAVKRFDDTGRDDVARLAGKLGLPEDTSPQAVIDAAVRRFADQQVQDARYDRELAIAASLGRDVPPPRRGADAKTVLDWAQATGRISAAARPRMEAAWERDPEGTEATVRILGRAQLTGLAASAPTAAPVQTASGLDVSRLPPRLQRAAAREPDRGKVYRWIEHYGGLSDVDPTMLELEGEAEFAAAVRADDGEARAEAAAASAAAIQAANDAHQRRMMAEHERRMQEARAHYGDAAT
jgi:hypothetical protein